MPPIDERGLLPSYDELAQTFAAGAQVVATQKSGGAISLSFVTAATQGRAAPPPSIRGTPRSPG
jgi:hypothetical protein